MSTTATALIVVASSFSDTAMSGLHNADITKGLMVFTGVNTLLASILDVKPYLHLQLSPHITKYHQYWRLVTHPLAFQNSTELVVGIMLLMQLGAGIERSYGPRKFAAFVLLASLVSTIISTLALMALYPLFGIRFIPAGPYGLIFALLWQRHRIVPDIYAFRVFGVEMTNKFAANLFALQLAFSDPPASAVAAISGLAAGYIYRADHLPAPSFLRRRMTVFNRPLKTYRLSQPLSNLFARVFEPLLGRASAPRRSHRSLPGETGIGRGSNPATDATLLRALWEGRAAARERQAVTETGAVQRNANLAPPSLATAAAARRSATAPSSPATETPRGVAGIAAGAGQARAAVGEWVSEMTGPAGARAPTDEEIATLSSMFPNISREAIVRALQRNDYNTAQAIEALLDEHS